VVTIWSTYGDYHAARVRALAESGFEVVPFAHCEYESAYPLFRARPDSLIVVNRCAGDQINRLLSCWRTWRLLRIHRPEIVLTAGYERTESLAACLYARTSQGHSGGRRPIVIVMLDNRADDHPRNRLVELIKSAYVRVFDGFLASGSDTRDYLKGLGVPDSRIELGYDCVDNETIATLVAHHRATSQGASEKGRYFLCVTRLITVKNLPRVVHAYHSYLQLLSDSENPIPLVICGDGPERGSIEDLIQLLGLESLISLIGEAAGIDAVASQLAFCSALILASTSETWGLVVNEAMAAGCPVVVSRQCGCARDLVEQGVNGFIFDGEQSDELARYMVWLHSNPGLLEAMGRRSKEIIAGFTTARFASSASKLAISARGSTTARDPINLE
jgi:1,2-diacylglycerol 3-alpha-glucosyltransferase